MSKYIIEVEDTPFTTPFITDNALYKAKEFNSLVFDEEGLSRLDPLKESEYGFYTKDAYEDGLKDAWDACRWIETADDEKRYEVFGTSWKCNIYAKFIPMQAVKMIGDYEQRKKDEKAKEELEELAERFGIHKIYDIVKEMRGE